MEVIFIYLIAGTWRLSLTRMYLYFLKPITWVFQCKRILTIYRKVSNIRGTLLGNKIVDHSDVVHLHLHSQLNTWLQWIGQRQLQHEKRNINIWGLGASYIRELTVTPVDGLTAILLKVWKFQHIEADKNNGHHCAAWHFQCVFLNKNDYFDSNFTEICT